MAIEVRIEETPILAKLIAVRGEQGADGDDGVSIVSATINADRHLIETLSDGTTIDCGYVGGGGATYTAGDNITISSDNVISATDTTYGVATQQTDGLMSSTDKSKLNGIETSAEVNHIDIVKVNGTVLDITNKSVDVIVPTKTSDLTNDSGFLTSHQDISGKENTSNKVTSLSSSSTDTQYPSAKCVSDALGLMQSQLNVTETIYNKVTSLSASSTDTQYPSAKCVYDLIGDVSTAITAINTIIGGNE